MSRSTLAATTTVALALGAAALIPSTTAVATSAAPAPAATPASAGALPAPQPFVAGSPVVATHTAAPPTTHHCVVTYGFPCYSPLQLRRAYGINKLRSEGISGRGAVIAIVDSFGSPTIRNDLHVFDHAYGLADPPKFRIVRPVGALPKWNPDNADMVGWASETTLDVEYAHAMAPQATIILAETPVSETEGVHGFPQIMDAERWLIHHTHVGVISQSFGATEETFPSASAIQKLRYAFQAARNNRVTVLGGSGDLGSTDYRLDMKHHYARRVNSWPSSDPLVTSVGGTTVHLTAKGDRTAADTVWNDPWGASGGGRSHVFGRPGFQQSVASIVGTHRGTPDISMNAAVTSRVPIYASFSGRPTGWSLIAGTSEATPIFAGVVALAIDKANRRLGYINPALYSLPGQASTGIVDVTGGDNGYDDVPGWPVVDGYDMGTGWGTVNAATFVPALVKAVKALS